MELELNRLIHEPIRFAIVDALATEPMTFNDLKSTVNATDGNLSGHAQS